MKNIQCNCIPFLIFCLLFLFSACGKKKEFLDERSKSQIFSPQTISDLQALLDNEIYLNEMPEIGVLSADEYYLVNGFWETLPVKERNCYVWAKDIFEGLGKVQDWNLPYKQVLYANIVLDRIEKGVIGEYTQRDLDYIKGAALFVRGLAFYNVAVNFAPIYDVSDVNKPGIPIRLKPDIDQVSHRATVDESYNQIIHDLKEASGLLPDSLPFLNRNRPCKAAAFAVLGRVYLSMRQYDKAGTAADSSLKYYNKLIDFNSLNPGSPLPFTTLNDETIYHGKLPTSSQVLIGFSKPACVIDSVLYKMYEVNDLRKQIFFLVNGNNQPNIKGGFSGSVFTFAGLAVDEVMLIRAECYARDNKLQDAMMMLNTLLRNRYKRGTYTDRVALTREVAMKMILEERRKELVFRGLRWIDLKRLNKEGAAITITRKLNNKLITLSPNDPKYLLPIPPDVISLGGIEPNER